MNGVRFIRLVFTWVIILQQIGFAIAIGIAIDHRAIAFRIEKLHAVAIALEIDGVFLPDGQTILVRDDKIDDAIVIQIDFIADMITGFVIKLGHIQHLVEIEIVLCIPNLPFFCCIDKLIRFAVSIDIDFLFIETRRMHFLGLQLACIVCTVGFVFVATRRK